MVYEEGTKILFDNGVWRGVGIVRGIATNYIPMIGTSWIIEILATDVGDESEYPYSHMVVCDAHITGVKANSDYDEDEDDMVDCGYERTPGGELRHVWRPKVDIAKIESFLRDKLSELEEGIGMLNFMEQTKMFRDYDEGSNKR